MLALELDKTMPDCAPDMEIRRAFCYGGPLVHPAMGEIEVMQQKPIDEQLVELALLSPAESVDGFGFRQLTFGVLLAVRLNHALEDVFRQWFHGVESLSMISKETARHVAQILFPELFQTSPIEAVAKAIEFLHEAAGGVDSNNQAPLTLAEVQLSSSAVKALADHMHKHRMHVNVVAKAVGVSTYTVRTWLEGKYRPNEENSAKITKFLESIQATPELLKPEL